MEDHLQCLFFEEEQRFPVWIRAIVLLPVVGLGCPAILLWVLRGENLGLLRIMFPALTLLALLGALLTFRMKLVTKLDSSNLYLRIYPLKWSLLPSRMTHKDVALSEICRWEVRTYNSLLSSEYWGWHFWGLAVAKGGRYLYVMRPSSPVAGRGVQLWLSSGERVLVGSERPEELENAIATANSASR
jgi:hypothetical protein